MPVPPVSLQHIDLSHPSAVRTLLATAGFRPSVAMGQNFLIDRNVLDRMLEAAAVKADEKVLEIGPGLGVLTGPLLARAGRLTAVEKDARLYAWLCERFAHCRNGRFLQGDYLDLAPGDPGLQAVDAVVSNLPYSVAARILVLLALSATPPRRMLVTVQKEVGERLTAGPGDHDYGLLSVLVGDGYATELLRTVSPRCFYPVPAVWSAVVRLQCRWGDGAPPSRPPLWLPLLRHAFSRRRKQMTGILADGPWVRQPDRIRAAAWLQAAGIPPDARPENLGRDAWRRLADQCAELIPRQNTGSAVSDAVP